MRRATVIVLICLLQVAFVAGLASAASPGFYDGFRSLDPARWTKEEHELGRSRLEAENVAVANGNLRMKLPAGTLEGAEIRSRAPYYHGTYEARMKLPKAPSSITGFFLYESPDYAAEIDIELPNDSSRRIWFTTYAGGRMTNHAEMRLPFDATAAFHTYAFRFTREGVRFAVDGKTVKTFPEGRTRRSMHLFVNAWYPTWLEGKRPSRDSYLLVDSIRHVR